MNTIGKRYGVLAVCAALLIALDQWAKSMAYNTLRVNGPLVLIKGVFELLYSENRALLWNSSGKTVVFLPGCCGCRDRGPCFCGKASFRQPVSAALYFHGPSSFPARSET